MKNDFPERIQKLPTYDENFPANVLEADGCKVYFSNLKAGSVIPPHDHETDNHSVVIKGELKLSIGGHEKSYKQGQWCFVPAKEIHSAKTEENTSLIEFWFE